MTEETCAKLLDRAGAPPEAFELLHRAAVGGVCCYLLFVIASGELVQDALGIGMLILLGVLVVLVLVVPQRYLPGARGSLAESTACTALHDRVRVAKHSRLTSWRAALPWPAEVFVYVSHNPMERVPTVLTPAHEQVNATAPNVRQWLAISATVIATAALAVRAPGDIAGVALGVLILTPNILRALTPHPLRLLGRWAIIADPETIEIPRWLRGKRVFQWETSDLVVLGVYGMMARVCVVDRDTTAFATFHMPKANLPDLISVAVAHATPERTPPEGEDAP